MTYKFALMTQSQAEMIAFSWHYEGKYAFYNMVADADDLAEFLDAEQRGQSVFAIMDEAELIGFISVHRTDVDTVDLGLGMNPDLTGNGSGRAFVTSILAFVEDAFSPRHITLSVATFNARAIRVYEACGFEKTLTFQQDTNGSTFEFIAMTKALRT